MNWLFVAIDTSSLVAYLAGDAGADTEVVDAAWSDKLAVLPPVVLTELLSAPALSPKLAATFLALPLLELSDGYWERAGWLRARLVAARYKARLADTLIAQVCIDHDVPLVTRDKDFRHFVRGGYLTLLP